MAQTHIYVDPSIAADSGTGTIGDPFGDLEYAIVQTTYDTTNGTQVNIKAGTDEVLVAKINVAMADTSVSVAWVPSQAAPLTFRGYTAVADDGGIGSIDGNGAGAYTYTYHFVHWLDLEIFNCGTDPVVNNGQYGSFDKCHIHTTTGGGIRTAGDNAVTRCYIHAVGYIGIWNPTGYTGYNYLYDDGVEFTFSAIYMQSNIGHCERNIVQLSLAGNDQDGIAGSSRMQINNNAVWSNGGTGCGIKLLSVNNYPYCITNNLVEGFSGAGGIGINYSYSTNQQAFRRGANAVYNCTTAYKALANLVGVDYGDDETLTASPFTDAANGDFSPVDTGNVKEGALPSTLAGP